MNFTTSFLPLFLHINLQLQVLLLCFYNSFYHFSFTTFFYKEIYHFNFTIFLQMNLQLYFYHFFYKIIYHFIFTNFVV